MTDNWFIQDIEHQLKNRNRVVVLDPKGQCGFLLPLLVLKGYKVICTDSNLTEQWQTVKEELFLRQQAETLNKEDAVVFYVTREQSKLSFLFDYCFTHGCLDLSNPIDWLKKKVFANTGLQVQQESKTLWIWAKLGVGKDISWWKKVIPEIEKPIRIGEELLPFLNDPKGYLENKEDDVRKYFEEIIFELLGQPYMPKLPGILAGEVVKRLLDGLANNDVPPELLQLYYRWADSETYRPSLGNYISGYKLDPKTNPWSAHPDHCFIELDNKALLLISQNIINKSYVEEKLAKIKARVKSPKVKLFVPNWWTDVITLLEFDTKPLTTCNSFNKVVDFYTLQFSNADRAIRNLYSHFLQEEAIIRPLQEYYESLNLELLHRWFEFTGDYKTTQQGFLATLIRSAKPGIAVIVGDGIRYEIADYVSTILEKQFKVERQVMLADLPSETEHNMSALYAGNNEVIALHKDREKRLADSTGKKITFLNLEALNYGSKANYLVLTYGDIDKSGEKLQQGAVKLFQEFEKILAEKITLLLNIGYSEVYLITDHGFVLTGLLDEADKIEPSVTGKKEVHERFIRTVETQNSENWIGFKKIRGEFNYVYVAKNHKPFKSKGVYGYSHGGFTPQEIIIPRFVFSKPKTAVPGLTVMIDNIVELSEITGAFFAIRLRAEQPKPDLFASFRKVQVLLYSGSLNIGKSNIITIQAGKTESLEFSFGSSTELQAVLVDAGSLEQLDSVHIKKSNLRDLGGLL